MLRTRWAVHSGFVFFGGSVRWMDLTRSATLGLQSVCFVSDGRRAGADNDSVGNDK